MILSRSLCICRMELMSEVCVEEGGIGEVEKRRIPL